MVSPRWGLVRLSWVAETVPRGLVHDAILFTVSMPKGPVAASFPQGQKTFSNQGSRASIIKRTCRGPILGRIEALQKTQRFMYSILSRSTRFAQFYTRPLLRSVQPWSFFWRRVHVCLSSALADSDVHSRPSETLRDIIVY